LRLMLVRQPLIQSITTVLPSSVQTPPVRASMSLKAWPFESRVASLGLTDPSCTSCVSGLPGWLQRWNFIERARHERALWEAFEQRQDIEALVEQCRAAVEAGDQGRAFELEVWSTTLTRIRKIEKMMGDRQRPSD
jgi:hypothetical protein